MNVAPVLSAHACAVHIYAWFIICIIHRAPTTYLSVDRFKRLHILIRARRKLCMSLVKVHCIIIVCVWWRRWSLELLRTSSSIALWWMIIAQVKANCFTRWEEVKAQIHQFIWEIYVYDVGIYIYMAKTGRKTNRWWWLCWFIWCVWIFSS